MSGWLRGFWKFFRKEPTGATHEKAAESGQELGAAPILAQLNSQRIRRSVDDARVQIGLDFGTFATKVLARVQGRPGARTILLDLGGSGTAGVPKSSVPSLAAFDGNGRLRFGHDAAVVLEGGSWEDGLSRFKMLMAGRVETRYLDRDHSARYDRYVTRHRPTPEDCRPDAVSAAFLAWVIATAERELRAVLGTRSLHSVVNVCLPIDQRENNEVLQLFERVLAVAQILATEPDLVDWSDYLPLVHRAGELLKEVQYDVKADSTRFFCVPEAVAGAAAFTTSLRKSDGIHAIVDIGAGTTDVSIFNLSTRSREGTKSFWYAARSIPMGMGRLEDQIASEYAKENGGVAPDRQQVLRIMREPNDKVRAIILEELRAIAHGCLRPWTEAYGHRKRESEWVRDKVKVFLAGGGARLVGAREVFSESWMPQWGPYPTELLPEPDTNAAWDASEPFERLCVAFGLTTPIPELGAYVMPAECPDQTPPRAPERSYEADGDQLLPKAGWV